MKRQAAFTGSSKLLKGGLHCHTTRSDGAGSPEDVLRLHIANGYDFLALTDHRRYNFESFGVSGITVIPGMEWDAWFEGTRLPSIHCHHIVCIGPSKEDGNGYEQDQRFESGCIAEPMQTQAMLDDIHAKKNLTIYCHPQWSGTPAREFESLQGNFAMELWNSGCVICDSIDTDNGQLWDELLGSGKRIFGVATDDGHAMSHHCHGWVRVNSENSVPAILEALANGAFYASCGPEIYDFRVENGVARVECSPACEVRFRNMHVPYRAVHPEDGAETMMSAECKLFRSCGTQYIRAVVKDAAGNLAWTNPIFLEDSDFE